MNRGAFFVGCLAMAALLAGFAAPVRAVVVLDSTWQSEGGSRKRPWAGFGAHLRLAAEPQFRAVLALASEDGITASGTWIGNDDRYAYVLTAAHNYEQPAGVDDYAVITPGGDLRRADRVWVHPKWNGDNDTRTGFDLAILRLPKPITDAGPPPLLYAGEDEAGQIITFVGFGSRGIGSTGEQDAFYRGAGKAAAQGLVEEWEPLVKPKRRDDDAGNYLGIYLPKEDGSVDSPYDGKTTPATPLVGLLGSGDSGGSAWMPQGGGWVLVAVNSNGSGEATYGEQSWFTRVAPHQDWITEIFPQARFAE